MWYRLIGFPDGASGKEPACQCRRHKFYPWVRNPLEEGMASHSSILAWRTSWTEEPGRLQSIGSQMVRHNWSDLHAEGFWNPEMLKGVLLYTVKRLGPHSMLGIIKVLDPLQYQILFLVSFTGKLKPNNHRYLTGDGRDILLFSKLWCISFFFLNFFYFFIYFY